jgi:hypothetical protein
MSVLHDAFASQIDSLRAGRDALLKSRGDHTISEITVAQAFGGMREVRALVCDTSVVDPERGLIIRGIPVLDLLDRLPEEIFFLLLIGTTSRRRRIKGRARRHRWSTACIRSHMARHRSAAQGFSPHDHALGRHSGAGARISDGEGGGQRNPARRDMAFDS